MCHAPRTCSSTIKAIDAMLVGVSHTLLLQSYLPVWHLVKRHCIVCSAKDSLRLQACGMHACQHRIGAVWHLSKCRVLFLPAYICLKGRAVLQPKLEAQLWYLPLTLAWMKQFLGCAGDGAAAAKGDVLSCGGGRPTGGPRHATRPSQRRALVIPQWPD